MLQRDSQKKELLLQHETVLFKNKTFSYLFMAISCRVFRSATFWQWTTTGA
jgi:hypothetical protein